MKRKTAILLLLILILNITITPNLDFNNWELSSLAKI